MQPGFDYLAAVREAERRLAVTQKAAEEARELYEKSIRAAATPYYSKNEKPHVCRGCFYCTGGVDSE